ncbi:MAG: hypothetical protein FJW23_01430 [Acidimicrobiia bacterium]|nr:hypothetical protein [Acidimicrobiia bacterium]
MSFDAPRRVIAEAVAARACPAAVVDVGDATRPLWREAFGRLTFEVDAPAATPDTIFDLASLTKVLATTPIVMQMAERGTLSLDDRVDGLVPGWRGTDRAEVTIEDLLAHCSGLPAWRPFYESCVGREAFEQAIVDLPLEYAPRSRSEYSDPGFMLLAFIVEDAGGIRLDDRFQTLLAQMGVVDRMQFTPPSRWRPDVAPTEYDPWRGRLLVGEVHDENAAALGGVAGHAGLFGTAGAVAACARHLLQIAGGRTGAFQPSTLAHFTSRRTGVPGSSRALGWDTMLPTSSCGTRMSPRAFGHTGFTGTSLWIDPDRGIYAVLLTNRVHPTRANDLIRAVRPAFHDAVMDALT